MTSTELSSGRDVVTFLTGQHEQIKALFEDVVQASGEQRTTAFTALRRLLAVHETAEEEIVHPRARREIDGGEDIVGARLKEENEAKQTLAALEKMDVDSAEFETMFRELQADVLTHAKAEEEQEFSRLAAELDAAELERMRNAVKLAESVAPTRPHAGVESAGANLLAGPFAAMLDRTRDLLSGKSNDAEGTV
jgi:hemerythrin superfamily protein